MIYGDKISHRAPLRRNAVSNLSNDRATAKERKKCGNADIVLRERENKKKLD